MTQLIHEGEPEQMKLKATATIVLVLIGISVLPTAELVQAGPGQPSCTLSATPTEADVYLDTLEIDPASTTFTFSQNNFISTEFQYVKVTVDGGSPSYGFQSTTGLTVPFPITGVPRPMEDVVGIAVSPILVPQLPFPDPGMVYVVEYGYSSSNDSSTLNTSSLCSETFTFTFVESRDGSSSPDFSCDDCLDGILERLGKGEVERLLPNTI